MLKNYFLIMWRGLVKNRAYSFINILGLAIGMGVMLLISLWMLDELSYNKDFPTYNRVVRVSWRTGSGIWRVSLRSLPFLSAVSVCSGWPVSWRSSGSRRSG